MKMFKIIFFIIILSSMNLFGRPGWDQDPDNRTYRATASIEVINLSGDPVPNISGTFVFKMNFDTDGDGYIEENDPTANRYKSESFTTDQQGNAFVELFITVPRDWYNGWKHVYVSGISGQINGTNITIIESYDTQSHTNFNIYPSYMVLPESDFIDDDENGIYDPYEMQLAKKFCPTYILNSSTDYIRPEPVQSIGVDKQDLQFFVYDLSGDEIGHYNFDQQNLFDPPIELWHAWMGNNDGRYDFLTYTGYDYQGRPPGKSKGDYHLRFHLNFANDCNSESCWSNFYSDERLSNEYPNTVYAHLFTRNNSIIIQYWTFYPYNDFINNHEGDWEHINVWVNYGRPENCNMQKVEYYFHHKYLDRYKNEIELNDNTHPVVYVGGQNSTAPGKHSGGNFPEAKFWTGAGAVGFDERVLGEGPTVLHSSFIDSSPNDEYGIVILPDINDIDFHDNPDMSWFGTKIPWGIPTTDTYMGWVEGLPGVPEMDRPPQGHAYRAGWNDVYDADGGYEYYEE